MAQFLTSNDLNAALEDVFEQADEYLLLISPYIKLHDRYASALRAKMSEYKLQITVVFGKNEDDYAKSMKEEDFNFFKQFPNIEIRYEKRLHAKYYANEKAAILTSMNLYNFSQDNNIEAGVLINNKGIVGAFTGDNSLDNQAGGYFERVIEQSELLFLKQPQFESAMFGFSEKYTKSEIKTDKLTEFFSNKKNSDSIKKVSTPSKISSNQKMDSAPNKMTGFCIRTGVEIPFNPKIPMCDTAYLSLFRRAIEWGDNYFKTYP